MKRSKMNLQWELLLSPQLRQDYDDSFNQFKIVIYKIIFSKEMRKYQIFPSPNFSLSKVLTITMRVEPPANI